MIIGYIKINGFVASLFVNKSDDHIKQICLDVKKTFEDQGLVADISWDNIQTEKASHDILKYIGFDYTPKQFV